MTSRPTPTGDKRRRIATGAISLALENLKALSAEIAYTSGELERGTTPPLGTRLPEPQGSAVPTEPETTPQRKR